MLSIYISSGATFFISRGLWNKKTGRGLETSFESTEWRMLPMNSTLLHRHISYDVGEAFTLLVALLLKTAQANINGCEVEHRKDNIISTLLEWVDPMKILWYLNDYKGLPLDQIFFAGYVSTPRRLQSSRVLPW